MRGAAGGDLVDGAGADERAAGGAAFGAEVDEPLGAAGELEAVEDRQAVPLDAQHLFAEAPSAAGVALDGDVGQKVHLERLRAVAAARFAAAAALVGGDVEAEGAGGEAEALGVQRFGEA